MADEADEGGGGDEGGGEDGGSVLKKYGPFAAIILLVQVVLAWVVIQYGLIGGGAEEEEVTFSPETPSVTVASDGQDDDSGGLPFYYSSGLLSNITANPAGTNSERFIVVTAQIGLKCTTEDGSQYGALNPTGFVATDPLFDNVLAYEQRIVSIITKTLRRKTVDELSGENIDLIEVDIRTELQQQIFDRLEFEGKPIEDKIECKPRVTDVDFTNMIIQ